MTPEATFAQSPFAVLTFIAAPALLTNASSVLAMSTINRMLRTRDRMHEMFAESQARKFEGREAARLVEQVGRVEKQAIILLRALRSIYVALASFAGATLVTLLGALLAPFHGALIFKVLSGLSLALGFCGVGGLIFGCANLFHATQLSLINIRQEADLIRERQGSKSTILDEP
jgi:hypothetical protein